MTEASILPSQGCHGPPALLARLGPAPGFGAEHDGEGLADLIARIVADKVAEAFGQPMLVENLLGAGGSVDAAETASRRMPTVLDSFPSTLLFIRSGRLIAIVVAAPARLTVLPNMPTFRKVDLEPVNHMGHYGLYGPKGLSCDVVDKIDAAARRTLDEQGVRKHIEDNGAFIGSGTPEQFGKQIKAELAVFRRVVVQQKVSLD